MGTPSIWQDAAPHRRRYVEDVMNVMGQHLMRSLSNQVVQAARNPGPRTCRTTTLSLVVMA